MAVALVTDDTWYVKLDKWEMTHDMWQVFFSSSSSKLENPNKKWVKIFLNHQSGRVEKRKEKGSACTQTKIKLHHEAIDAKTGKKLLILKYDNDICYSRSVCFQTKFTRWFYQCFFEDGIAVSCSNILSPRSFQDKTKQMIFNFTTNK